MVVITLKGMITRLRPSMNFMQRPVRRHCTKGVYLFARLASELGRLRPEKLLFLPRPELVYTQVFPDTRNDDDLDVQDVQQPRIHLIDVAAGEIRETLIAPHGFGRSLCFSPDGKTLATGGHGRVLLWDVAMSPGTNDAARGP